MNGDGWQAFFVDRESGTSYRRQERIRKRETGKKFLVNYVHIVCVHSVGIGNGVVFLVKKKKWRIREKQLVGEQK